MQTLGVEVVEESKEENGNKKHRRMRTYDLGTGKREGALRRGSVDNEGRDAMVKYVQSLPNEKRAELEKASNDMKAERTIKRLELKLEEAMDQRNQATEIIKNLAKENEELKLENEELKNVIQMKEHDLKILEKDFSLMNELYEEEKVKYEMELQKLDKMKREMVEREEQLELQAKEQEILETEKKQEMFLERHIKSFDGFEDTENTELSTAVEKKLYTQFQDEKRRTSQLKQQMDVLLTKLEDQSRLEEEVNQLKEYCNKLEQENAQQLDDANEINQSVHNEVIKLAHRNAHLERDKQELVKELEAKIYEISLLRKSLELSSLPSLQSNAAANASVNPNGADDDEDRRNANAMADEIYNSQKNDLLDAISPTFCV
ncbi:hypothetical protein RFI_30800 [Reticulomyxa filosa]|uniref:Uncharacterized protein n=1 Tax=Reticulomyxa filosa TaxID=46433 RepID=X6LZL2_RETFI|nr:hypothetical protein RFI_30800 [Reticulomyxa filosa]|eukprot:ETO06592.1 hypothetical protein RFI_30800 [Reticulomyxa filosa]